MWLCYLRFDDQGKIVTYHVRCPAKGTAEELFKRAEQHGLTKTAQLVEYALFHAGLTIYPREVPNFHFYDCWDFLQKWQQVTL